MEDIRKLRHQINYKIKNMELFKEAFTHRSYASEHKLDYDNQRLEYLGDAVVEIILSDTLFKRYPDSPEGLLTKMRSALVRQDSLAKLARQLKLDEFIRMGRGEMESGGPQRESTLCDLFEAMIGAVYLDSSLEETAKVLVPLFNEHFPDPLELLKSQNPKGGLQEYSQKKWGKAPVYQLHDVNGPDHEPKFVVTVSVNGNVIGRGVAGKRKTAEGLAAKDALKQIKDI